MNFTLTTTKAFQVFHILRQGAVILINIFLAKSILGADAIGSYEKLAFLSFTVSYFWVSGLTKGLLSTYPKLATNHQPRLLFQLYWCFIGMSLLLFILLNAGEYWVANYLLGQSELPYYTLFITYMLLNFPTYLVENIYLLRNEPKAIVAFGIFSFGIHALAVLVPIYLGYDFRWSFIGLITMAAIKHIWLISLLFRASIRDWDFSALKKLIWVAYPLMLYALVGGFAQVFDSWLVGWYYNNDSAQFAIFRYGARELPFALAVAAALSDSMLPQLASNIDSNLAEIKRKARILMHLLFPIAIVLTATSQWLYPIVFSPEFEASYTIFNVFLLVLISRLVFPNTILIALDENQFIFRISLFELFINISSSIFLIRYFGLAGIAMGTVIAYSFEKIAYTIFLKSRYQINFRQYTDVQWLSFYSMVLFAVFLVFTSF